MSARQPPDRYRRGCQRHSEGTSTSPTGTLYGAHQAITVQQSERSIVASQGIPALVRRLSQWQSGAPASSWGTWSTASRTTRPQAYEPPKGEPLHGLVIQRQPGTNTVEVVDRIKTLCRSSACRFRPRSMSACSTTACQSIRDSVNDVKFTLLLTVALVILVIFLFLRNISAT